jgi:hypothetical protein
MPEPALASLLEHVPEQALSPRVQVWLRWLFYAASAYFVCSGALEIYAALDCPLQYTADFIFDDAYYYLGVAYHLAHGQGSTFRPPLHTNGYQPLWLLTLASLGYLFSLSRRALFVTAIALTFAIKLGALFALRRRVPLALSLVVGFGWMQFVFSLGLETTLLALAVPCLPWLLAKEARSDREALLSGLGFAALFLVRLDCAALFVAHALLRRKLDRTLLLQAAVLTLVALSYFGLNFLWFGVPVPVSGLAKQLGNVPGENRVLGQYWPALTVCASLAFAHEVARRMFGENGRDRLDRAVWCCGLAALIVIAYYELGSGWHVWPWYRWPLALTFVFLFARSLWLALRANSRVALAALGALAVYLGAQGMGANKSDTLAALAAHHAPALQRAFPIIPSFNKDSVRMIERMFPPEGPAQTIVMGDRAGALGYWLPEPYRFIHSEGLVADAAFLRARAEGRGVEFVDALKPDLLIVDRDRVLQDGSLYGIAEPMQGTSMHRGVMLFCFPAQAIVDQQELPLGFGSWYTVRPRYTFDYRARKPCSEALNATLRDLLSRPDGLRDFSMPSEL